MFVFLDLQSHVFCIKEEMKDLAVQPRTSYSGTDAATSFAIKKVHSGKEGITTKDIWIQVKSHLRTIFKRARKNKREWEREKGTLRIKAVQPPDQDHSSFQLHSLSLPFIPSLLSLPFSTK